MGSGSSQTETVSGASETETMISDLMPSTTYVVQVAAVNGNSTGVYSNPISQLTGGVCVICIQPHHHYSPLQLRLQW